MKRSSTAGFSLLEMIIVVTILGIMAATVIPAATVVRQRAQLSGVLREIAANVKRARALAASQMPIPSSPSNRARFAAIEVPNNRTYQLIVDADSDPSNGNQGLVSVFPLGAGDDEAGLTITLPVSPNRVTISSNGTLISGSDTVIEVRDSRTNPPRMGQVLISQSGATRILYNKY